MVYSNKSHLRKSYYTVRYDNSTPLAGAVNWYGVLSNVSINLQNKHTQDSGGSTNRDNKGLFGLRAVCVWMRVWA